MEDRKTEDSPAHVPGKCWCGIIHSVAGAAEANSDTKQYENMIGRTTDGPDPLVQEP